MFVIPLKSWYLYAKIHVVIFQKIVMIDRRGQTYFFKKTDKYYNNVFDNGKGSTYVIMIERHL